jgi:hypothetical protein
MSAKSKFLGAAAIAGLVVADGLAFAPAHAETVTFIPGTYYLAEDYLGTPVDTLVVSISGGVAYFSLSGEDTATFAVQNNSTPTGMTAMATPATPTSRSPRLLAQAGTLRTILISLSGRRWMPAESPREQQPVIAERTFSTYSNRQTGPAKFSPSPSPSLRPGRSC